MHPSKVSYGRPRARLSVGVRAAWVGMGGTGPFGGGTGGRGEDNRADLLNGGVVSFMEAMTDAVTEPEVMDTVRARVAVEPDGDGMSDVVERLAAGRAKCRALEDEGVEMAASEARRGTAGDAIGFTLSELKDGTSDAGADLRRSTVGL